MLKSLTVLLSGNYKYLVFFIFVLFWGCASTNKSVSNLKDVTPETIQYNIIRNFKRLKSFEGRARVIIEIPGHGYSGTSKIYVNSPDSVFIKTEAILGIDIGSLFLDATRFGAYAPRENILYYGETETLDLKDFLQVDIKTDELMQALVGLVQLPENVEPTLRVVNNKFVLTVNSGDNILKYWVDPENYGIQKCLLINEKNEIILEKEYDRFKKDKGVLLPQTIKITRPLERERLTVHYINQKVNKNISSDKFKLKTASNARKVYWGDLVKPTINKSQLDQ